MGWARKEVQDRPSSESANWRCDDTTGSILTLRTMGKCGTGFQLKGVMCIVQLAIENLRTVISKEWKRHVRSPNLFEIFKYP